IRKKAIRVRAYRYRQAGVPLKEFPPVELPNWPKLAEFAASLVPKKVLSAGTGKSGHCGETPSTTRSVAGVKVTQPAAVEEEEDSPAPVGEAEAKPVARDDVHIGDALSDSEPSSEKTAAGEAE